MTFETCLTKVILIGFCHALVEFVDVDMQAELLADFLTDFRGRRVGMQEGKTCVKKYRAYCLRLLQGHF
jgi:hypothetical protein